LSLRSDFTIAEAFRFFDVRKTNCISIADFLKVLSGKLAIESTKEELVLFFKRYEKVTGKLRFGEF
jgi:Ca2+-binding EF-hand superfamily protein